MRVKPCSFGNCPEIVACNCRFCDLHKLITRSGLESFVRANAHQPCCVWTGPVDKKDGYGHGWFKFDGLAHRAAWRAFGCVDAKYNNVPGEIPSGLLVLHACDNPPCILPVHLFLGDHDTNMADMVAKGRSYCAQGEKHFMFGRHLPEAQKQKIRNSALKRYVISCDPDAANLVVLS
jgi:hypothetical protein